MKRNSKEVKTRKKNSRGNIEFQGDKRKIYVRYDGNKDDQQSTLFEAFPIHKYPNLPKDRFLTDLDTEHENAFREAIDTCYEGFSVDPPSCIKGSNLDDKVQKGLK